MCNKGRVLRGWTNYVCTARSIYPLAAALIYLRIPFEYVPHKKRAGKKRNYWQCGYVDFDLEDGGEVSISDIIYNLKDTYGDDMDFTIISQVNW